MTYSLSGGAIGLAIVTLGAIVMWAEEPQGYPIARIITALPGAWSGGFYSFNIAGMKKGRR